MRLYRLERTQILPISQLEAWTFFSQPQNLPRITPDWLAFKIKGVAEPDIYAGQVLHYRLKPLFGLPVTWISEITQVQEPAYFIDEQRFGPYRFWHHLHRFEPVAHDTQISDIVHYALGYGILGHWVHRWLVAFRLENIFNYRRTTLTSIFGENTKEQCERFN